MNNAILWEGKSRIDRKPIVAIATFHSKNKATGNMVQVFYLRSDIDPIVAAQTDQDYSVCGGCPLRSPTGDGKGNSCYVNLLMGGPLPVYKSYKAGNIPYITDDQLRLMLKRRLVRFGAYGDPVSAPLSLTEKIVEHSAGHTGYTHQWRLPIARGFNRYLMASIERPEDHAIAVSKNWRTFRSRLESEPILPGEFTCKKANELPEEKRLTCEHCLACDGFSRKGQQSVVIIAHGARPVMANYARMRERQSVLAS